MGDGLLVPVDVRLLCSKLHRRTRAEEDFGRNTNRQIAASLNTDGMYSLTRNLLNLGNFFMMLGVVMFVRVGWAGAFYVLEFWVYYRQIILAEQAFLKDHFANEYEDYLSKTPAFIPNFKHWRSFNLPFSVHNVLKREYSGFLR
jgi:protein-S-isoprenylcysteine O-methyltransferase Ste14